MNTLFNAYYVLYKYIILILHKFLQQFSAKFPIESRQFRIS